jgi:hypothetical protein
VIFYFVVINFIKYFISQLLHFALKVSRIKTENIFEPSTLCKTLISIKKLKTIRLQWTPVVVNPDYFIRHENVKRLNCQPSFFNPKKRMSRRKRMSRGVRSGYQTGTIPPFHRKIFIVC